MQSLELRLKVLQVGKLRWRGDGERNPAAAGWFRQERGLSSADDSAGVTRESLAKPGFTLEIFSAVQAEKK